MANEPRNDVSESSEETAVTRRNLLLAAAAAGSAKRVSDRLPDGDAVAERAARLEEALNVAGDLWVGPDAARPSSAREGWYYVATDTDREFYSTGDGWSERARARAVQQETADWVVTTTQELHQAFNNLSRGDSVYIDAQGAPYRTNQWLDIDVSSVTVQGPGIRELIKPADGANVGGIRIGHNNHCEYVRIRGVGFHGNPAGQDPNALRLHGFIVRDASSVTLQENFATRTHPFHVHNKGGSGFSVERGARHVAVLRNRVHDIGDRGIQLGGEHVLVHGNIGSQGFDRTIATNYYTADGSYGTRYASITNNLSDSVRTGSAVGVDGGSETPTRFVTVTGNVGFEPAHRLVYVKPNVGQVAVTGNVGVSTTSPPTDIPGIHIVTGQEDVVVTNNVVVGWRKGIWASTVGPPGTRFRGQTIPVKGYVITGNRVRGPGAEGIRAEGTDGIVANNSVRNAGLGGILVTNATNCQVTGNTVRESRGHGIRVDASATSCRVADNVLARNNRAQSGFNEIHVGASNTQVANNYVVERGGARSVYEADGADGNYYTGNRMPVDGQGRRIVGPRSVVDGGYPAFDLHRGVSDGDGDGAVTVSFRKPYTGQPMLLFGRRGGGIRNVTYQTNANGRYTGARITIGSNGGTVDVFVSGRVG